MGMTMTQKILAAAAGLSEVKAGQLIDRTGVRLGLQFPCGPALEQLALQSRVSYKIKPSMQGANCSLSGVENQVDKHLQAGETPADIARFVLSSVSAALLRIPTPKMAYKVWCRLCLLHMGSCRCCLPVA